MESVRPSTWRENCQPMSEGDRVSVTGYLHRAEEGSNSESVNCAGRDGRDIHLNLNKTKPVTEYNEWTGIVMEVAPQVPLPGWTSRDHVNVLHALQAVMAADRPGAGDRLADVRQRPSG